METALELIGFAANVKLYSDRLIIIRGFRFEFGLANFWGVRERMRAIERNEERGNKLGNI